MPRSARTSTAAAEGRWPGATDAERELLTSLIPDANEYQDYVGRKFGDYADMDILRYALASKINVLLEGPTGPGKTTLVQAFAAHDQLPIATVQCNGGVDPNTFWGGPSIKDGVLLDFQKSAIALICKFGGVLYLNEINFLHPRVTASFHGLTDRRRQVTIRKNGNETFKTADGLLVVVDYRPDYEGTRPLNAAFKNSNT